MSGVFTDDQEDHPYELVEYIDECIHLGPSKMFNSKTHSKLSVKRMRSFQSAIKLAANELRTSRLESTAKSSLVLYRAMIYKFGPSNRHQKFWRIAMQVYRELRRLNDQNKFEHFHKFARRLENNNFKCFPKRQAIRFLGAILLERILHLDKLRFICARSADCSMGYIELKHFLTFNLMSIAIASDIAKESLRQMHLLAQIYDALAKWFKKCAPSFPLNANTMRFKSISHCSLGQADLIQLKELKRHDLKVLCKEIEEIGKESSTEVEEYISPSSNLKRRERRTGSKKRSVGILQNVD